MIQNYEYTRIMRNMFRTQTSTLKTFYAREEFKSVVNAYKSASAGARPSIKRKLKRMCAPVGLDCDEIIKKSSLLDALPTRAELRDQLLDIFYSLYQYSPSSAAYMERLVYRLAPEYREDSVRTAILKKFVLGGGTDFTTYKTKAIIGWAVDKMDDSQKSAYLHSDAAHQLQLAAAMLDDSIFTPERLTADLSAKEQLQLAIDRRASLTSEINALAEGGIFSRRGPFTEDAAVNKTLRRFCTDHKIEVNKKAPSSEIMEKIENRMRSFCADHGLAIAQADDFICLLDGMLEGLMQREEAQISPEELEFALAHFRLLLRNTVYTTKNGSLSTANELFKTDIRDAEKRKLGTDWTLLQVCNQLAAANFKNNSNTRIVLYRFALMFGMTINPNYDQSPALSYDMSRDVTKNLFGDYYCDNLVRYLDRAYNSPGYAATQEAEPSGEAINLKNFAEAIYIYYIYRTDLPLTPGQRIDNAQKAIDTCIALAKKDPDRRVSTTADTFTAVYRDILLDQILCADEGELPQAIAEHYQIDPQSNAHIAQLSDTLTAFEFISDCAEDLDLDGAHSGYIHPDYGTNDGLSTEYSEHLDDARYSADRSFHWELGPLLIEKYADNPAFVRMVKQLDLHLSADIGVLVSREKLLLANMLHILYHNSDETNPMPSKKLRAAFRSDESALTAQEVTKYADTLTKLGFDVRRVTISDESRFCLGSRVYDDALLNRVMSLIKPKHWFNRSAVSDLLTQLIEARELYNRKVTRAKLLSVGARNYIADLPDTSKLTTLPALYEDFADYIDPFLIGARFQAFNEKNLLDLYILLSLYLNLIDNYNSADAPPQN